MFLFSSFRFVFFYHDLAANLRWKFGKSQSTDKKLRKKGEKYSTAKLVAKTDKWMDCLPQNKMNIYEVKTLN